MITAEHARMTAFVLALAAGLFLLAVAMQAFVFVIPPLVFAAIPLFVRAGPARRIATGVSAALLMVSAVLGLFVVGWLFIPGALVLVVAAFLPDRPPATR